MSNCETCGTELKGKQRKFCSNKCKCKASNHTIQNYTEQQNRAIRRKAKLVLMKGGECSICGYNKNLSAMIFHHLDPKIKSFELDSRALGNNSWETIMNEADKCILLCSNCHQELHHPDFTLELSEIDLETFERKFTSNLSNNSKNLSPVLNFCRICGAPIKSNSADKCSSCQHREQEKVPWPPTERLLKLLETNSYCAVGRMLGVSDNAIRKRIKNHPIVSNT